MNPKIGLALWIACMVAACWTSRPASYTNELVNCNQTAKTCDESIACENKVRARYNRPMRDADGGCK